MRPSWFLTVVTDSLRLKEGKMPAVKTKCDVCDRFCSRLVWVNRRKLYLHAQCEAALRARQAMRTLDRAMKARRVG